MQKSKANKLCEQAGIGWFEASNADLLADDLSKHIATVLDKELKANGSASLVVSGGSTPAPVFTKLSSVDIDWSNIAITLADERWVPPGHADSNESLVRDTLMVNKAANATFVSLYRASMEPEQAIAEVARDVLGMSQPFSLTILGMGGDGHTASLFPDAPATQLDEAMALDNTSTVALLAPPSVDQIRISLTRAALLNSRQRLLHITGQGKNDVLGDALEECADNNDGALKAYSQGMKPIVGLLTTQAESASVFWSP